MMMNSSLFRQIYRFVIVGVINTLVDIVVLNLLIVVTHQGKNGPYYTLFQGIAFVVAVINSYFMNKYWTFLSEVDKNKKAAVEMTQFIAVSVVGLILNVTAASMFVNTTNPILGLDKYWPTFGALVGTAVGLVWNFVGYRILVFNKGQKMV